MVELLLRPIADVTTAKNGNDAVLVLRGEKLPDLVITDLMMPGMDGLSLTRFMKADKRLARIPVVMLTAKGTPRDVVAGIQAGARNYLTKPFKSAELLAKVNQALGRKG